MILETVDARTLTKEERYERGNILWLWYHHAITYAVWIRKDRMLAQRYSSLALKNQPEGHPNKITRLLYLLIRDRLADAKIWSRTIRATKGNPEKETAAHIIKRYEDGAFFKK